MFVDDMILFGEATLRKMQCVMRSLNKFCAISGEQVSHEKTRILFSIIDSQNMKERLLSMSGFKETTSLSKYLGVLLTSKAPKQSNYQHSIDQVSFKLKLWKGSHIAFAGRVTLAKSVIEAMFIYPMMTIMIHRTCIKDIHKL